jgi:hypothetical protein
MMDRKSLERDGGLQDLTLWFSVMDTTGHDEIHSSAPRHKHL